MAPQRPPWLQDIQDKDILCHTEHDLGAIQTLYKGLMQSTFNAKMPFSQAPEGIFGACKGQKSSKKDGPITGQQANGPGQGF